MTIETACSGAECRKRILEQQQNQGEPGQSRFRVRTTGRFFSAAYYSGQEYGRRVYLISNKIFGAIREKDGHTHIVYRHFFGWTDPITLLLLLLAGTAALLFRRSQMPDGSAVSWGDAAVPAAAIAVLILVSCAVSAFSAQGIRNRKALDSFVTDIAA